jgi:hypothetical protein
MIGIISRIRFLGQMAAADFDNNPLVVRAVKELLLGNCSSRSRVWLGSKTQTAQTMVEPRATHKRRLNTPDTL